MFAHVDKESSRLEKILEKYNEICQGDASELRRLIPSNEIWRFFIEAEVQQKGRNLRNDQELQGYEFYEDDEDEEFDPLIIPIKDLILNEETGLKRWQDGNLITLLKDYDWELDEIRFEQLSLNNIYELDKGWVPFEISEKGYLQALYKAFQLVMDDNRKLDMHFILTLHELAVTNVMNTNYDKSEKDKSIGEFTDIMSFKLHQDNTTHNGIEALLQSKFDDLFIGIPLAAHEYGYLVINKELIDKLSSQTLQEIDPNEFIFIRFGYKPDQSEMSEIILETQGMLSELKGKTISELAELIVLLQEERPIQMFRNSAQSTKKPEMRLNELLQNYEQELEASKSELDKLKAIIKFIQSCEQLHPFQDANCRTFCMLVFLHELRVNGFPLAIIADPNFFDGFSLSEMLDETLEGMNNTFKLIEEKELFNFDTNHFIKSLNVNNKDDSDFYAEILAYFSEITAMEEHARKQPTTTHQPQLNIASRYL